MAEHVDQGVEAELVDLSADEIVKAWLRDPEALCRFPLTHAAHGLREGMRGSRLRRDPRKIPVARGPSDY
jgi:hypothetical protein